MIIPMLETGTVKRILNLPILQLYFLEMVFSIDSTRISIYKTTE